MEHVHTIVIGAGPAGLQMAYFLARAGRDYRVLEAAGSAGAFFATQPRHRKLLSLNKRFNGFPEPEFNMRHDWNSLVTEEPDRRFTEYSEELYPSADDVRRYFEDFAERHALRIEYGTRVVSVAREPGGRFVVTDAAGKVRTCTVLLVATGACSPYLPPDIDGIELAEGYEDHDIDPNRYANKSVLVIGRGNSAFEVANHLAAHAGIIHVAIGNRPLQMAWTTHSVRNVRAVNNTVVEMLHVKALHGAVGLNVRALRRAPGGGLDVDADEEVPNWQEPGILQLRLHYDHVIRCTGFRYVTPELFAEDVVPRACSKTKYPVLDSSWQSTTPDLYYMGTAMAALDKKSASSFIHGFRYNIRTLFHLLEEKYHGVKLPSVSYPLSSPAELASLADRLLERLSTTAALYQQYGFLCDVLRLSDGRCEIFRELPRAYALEDDRFKTGDIVLLSFEYGFQRYPEGTDPLTFITQMDEATSRRCAAYLHPIFRHYRDGVLVEEDNLGESLTLRYSRHRPGGQDGGMPEEDVERNIVMNILNRVVKITKDVFSEKALLANHGFKPWPKDRPLDARGLPRCAPSSSAAMGHGGE